MAKQEKEYKYNIGLYDVAHRDFILSLLNEYNIDYQEEWVSIYDDFITLSCEPITPTGFEYNVRVNGKPEVINFIDYLIKQHIGNIEKLNRLIKETKEDK